MTFRNVEEIASWRLCVGCGACVYVCPEKKIVMVDREKEGLRPLIRSKICRDCDDCVRVCPGLEAGNQFKGGRGGQIAAIREGFGPVLEVWEGFAPDPEIRFQGSSGGASTALALYCLEKEGMDAVIHSGFDEQIPWRNRPVVSLGREDLLSRTGSRYGPASVCDGLASVESIPSSCVFIGKPCDVEGLRKIQAFKYELNAKVGLAIGIFCAGTPATRGTLDLLNEMKIAPDSVEEIRYRGKGWPGNFSVRLKGERNEIRGMSYRRSWGFLQKYRPFRCYLCPDGTAEFADISCGDPWYREIKEGDLGHSLVLVRTEKGQKAIRGAVEAGYLTLESVPPNIVGKSQASLLAKRREIWGRLLALRIAGIPAPQYDGFPLYENWRKLPTKDKAWSIIGTFRRILQRKYYKPLDYGREEGVGTIF
jgi:coenzyme F420 hydrogenase subunit beta